MPRPSVAKIELAALLHNFSAIERHVAANRPEGPAPHAIAVVKANAYGHGAVEVAACLERGGARMFACADLDEAVVLRQAGIAAPILVFGTLAFDDFGALFDHSITPTIGSLLTARRLQAAAARRGTRIQCHLKIDTGLNRTGFRFDDLDRAMPEVLASPGLDVEGVYTHFATADDNEHPLFELQLERYRLAIAQLERLGLRRPLRHAANSAAVMRDPGCWYEAVRPGLALYGVRPSAGVPPVPLLPVLSLRSRVVAVNELRAGESVGYGARFVAGGAASIAVVPLGYGDGLDYRLAGRASALVGGCKVPVVGSVCMDSLALDVTGLPVQVGDEVVLIGRQGQESITVEEMARAIGTIPYEVLSRIGVRVLREYVSG
jgi:alanine racemase